MLDVNDNNLKSFTTLKFIHINTTFSQHPHDISYLCTAPRSREVVAMDEHGLSKSNIATGVSVESQFKFQIDDLQ